MKNPSSDNPLHRLLFVENIILAVIVLQLVILSPINYFLFLPTSFIRWGIDACLYTFALIIFIRLSIRTGFKPDKIIFLYVAIAMVNVASYIANDSDRLSMIKQVRFTFMGGMLYVLLLYGDFSEKFFKKILKIIFFTGYIQLPLVIIQLLTYNDVYLRHSEFSVDYVDYAAGSIENSSVLGTFLMLLATVKIQQGIEHKFKTSTVMQLVVLLAPLGLINSDAQFFFLPAVIVFAIFINRKLAKIIFKMLAVSLIVFLVINSLLLYNWQGTRSITKYITSFLANNIFSMSNIYDPDKNRLLRHESIVYVWEADTQNPGMHILFGKGPGYWLGRDSEGGEHSITNVWYHCNTVLLMYAELGLGGLLVFLLLPLIIYIDADNSYWGKIIKIQAFYLFLSLFYHHPFNELTLSITSITFIVYYRKFYTKKQTPLIIRQEIFRNKAMRVVPASRRPVQIGVQTLQ